MAWVAAAPAARGAVPELGWFGRWAEKVFPVVEERCDFSGRKMQLRQDPREFELPRSSYGIRTVGRCKAVLSTPALPPQSAEELQDAFGRQGLFFNNVGGNATAQLKLADGSRASVLVSGARVTSYKAHMWHKGEEEFLLTRRSIPEDGMPSSLLGGIELRFCHSQDPLSSIFSTSDNAWTVEEVSCDPLKHSQITLANTSNFEMGIVKPVKGSLKFWYVVTLTQSSLATALIVSNTGRHPVEFTGSIVTRMAVSCVDAAFATGLVGYGYRCLSKPLVPPKNMSLWDRFLYSKQTDKRVASPPPEATGNYALELERGRWIDEKDHCSQVYEGDDRLYPTPPSAFTLLDRGFRRSIEIQREGDFEEFFLSNPGESEGDWDEFVNVGPAQTWNPVRLKPNEQWRGAQVLYNIGFGGSGSEYKD